MAEYVFPFSSCEQPHDFFIRQPASAFVTLLTIAHLFKKYLDNNIPLQKNAILSYILFETFHMFSHCFHTLGELHVVGTHCLFYLMIYQIHRAFAEIRGPLHQNKYYQLYVCVAIDIVVFILINGVYSILTAFSILGFMVYCFCKHIGLGCSVYMVVGGILAGVLLINEALYCEQMLNVLPFPPHILIEVNGFFMFRELTKMVVPCLKDQKLS